MGWAEGSCGGAEWGALSTGQRAPGALLAEMRSGLAVISLTTEGDPIVAFYRTAADTSEVEKFTDRV